MTPVRCGYRGIGLVAALVMGAGMACSSHDTPTRTAEPETSVRPAQEIVMPDFVGLYWSEAEPQLRSLGWEGVLDKGPNMWAGPADRNRVMFQDPAAGGRIDADGMITLRFGL